ncbi:hypothetical protein J2125_002867 [Erwinia toletana]|uniref:Uncharacterized protein n=1 Tax=Winslowiella toletana TaxID=92490 RepID=A0ABS4PC30_9GAMM|nr:hypothetical protein [Winslowiella toletana]
MKKTGTAILVLIILTTGAYIAQQLSRPVEVIAVHQDKNWSTVLVKNFPITADGKVDW